VRGGNPIAVLLESISGVSAINLNIDRYVHTNLDITKHNFCLFPKENQREVTEYIQRCPHHTVYQKPRGKLHTVVNHW
jgi:hypothetical protein